MRFRHERLVVREVASAVRAALTGAGTPFAPAAERWPCAMGSRARCSSPAWQLPVGHRRRPNWRRGSRAASSRGAEVQTAPAAADTSTTTARRTAAQARPGGTADARATARRCARSGRWTRPTSWRRRRTASTSSTSTRRTSACSTSGARRRGRRGTLGSAAAAQRRRRAARRGAVGARRRAGRGARGARLRSSMPTDGAAVLLRAVPAALAHGTTRRGRCEATSNASSGRSGCPGRTARRRRWRAGRR